MEQPETQSQPLVCPSHKTSYVAILILGVLLGATAMYMYAYDKGFAAAKKVVIDSPLGTLAQTPDDVRTLFGVVTAIEGDSIMIKAHSSNIFDTPSSLERTIKVVNTTKLTKRTSGDIEAFMVAQEAFMKKIQSGAKDVGTPPTTPESVTTPIELSTVIVGDTVVVTASENIASTKSFTASEIEVR